MTFSAIYAFLWGLKGPEIILIAVVVLLLFGTSKIPSIMRNLGKGVHAFKQGVEDAKAEINKEVTPANQKKEEAENA